MFRIPLVRRLVPGLLGVGLLLGSPAPVAAHAELVASEPAPNASLVEGPGRVELTFSEPIDPENAFVDLLDPTQRPVEVGRVRVTADGLRATVDFPTLEPGVYTVSYQVVSTVDGHATAGIYAFLVDPTGAAPPPTDTSVASSPSVDPLTIAARWVALAFGLVTFGSALFWLVTARRVLGGRLHATSPPWPLLTAGALLTAVGLVAYLSLSARPIADAPGTSGTGIPFDPAAPFGWTPFALAMRAGIGASLLAAIVAGRSWMVARTGTGAVLITGALAAGSLGTMSLAGHAASYGGIGFAVIDWVHLVAVGAWLGALPAALAIGMRTAGDRRATVSVLMRGHGRVALVAAPLVALTGIANSPLVLGSARDLVASDYGNLIVAKAGLLSIALGIGAVNHLALRGRGRAAVVGLIGAELLVAIFAVSAAAAMVTIQPAAARQAELATPPVNPAHLFGQAGPTRVHVAVSVPAPGNQSYRVTVTDVETGIPPADVQKVFLEFAPPAGSDLPSDRVELEPDPRSPALYVTNGAFTPIEGEWGLTTVVRRAGALDASASFEIPVTSPGPPELGPPEETGIGVPAPIAASWGLLPPGLLGWTPALVLLVLLVLLGRAGPGAPRAVARGATATALVVLVLAAGSRTLVIAANAPSAADLAGRPVVDAPGDSERGAAIYRANCASCHGIDGRGDGPVDTLPPSGALDTAVAAATDAELSYRIAYGVAGTPMPAFAGLLTAEERNDLVAHLRDRWGGGDAP